jgi:two-component system response regulator PilR (NtrC family)
MESELFGHRKGAFTGASSERIGVFQAAEGGTLFLDEIAELELGTQVKLLRALQERKVRPVGATEEIDIDCRIVAATNRDLSAAIAAKEFREDLYFRLNVVQVVLPPLRHRREDIAALLNRFVERFCAEMNRTVEGITPEALRWFLDYDYPGNVRELENLVERAVALESSEWLTAEHLPTASVARTPSELPSEGLDLDAALQDLERTLITAALRRSKGVRKDAAELLGLSMRSLRYRIAKLGIPGNT